MGTSLRPRCRGALAAGAAFYAVFVARTAFRWRGRLYFSLFDDGMVSMRYARNLAHGHGLVWNTVGRPVEGYTNLLWTLWMAALHRVGAPAPMVSLLVMLSSLGILLANLLVVRALAWRLAPGSATTVRAAVWASAFCYPLVYWSLRGMEVGLVALELSLAVLLAVRRDLRLLSLVLAAGLLTRTDFVVPAVVVATFAVWASPAERRRQTAVVLGAVLGVVLAGHTAFRLAYYGDALPNTYYLKVAGFSLGARLHRGMLSLLHLFAIGGWAPLALAAVGLRRAGGDPARRRLAWVLAALVAGQAAYSAAVGGDAWEWMDYENRYLAPALPLLLVLAAGGLERLWRTADTAARAADLRVVAVFALAAAVAGPLVPAAALQLRGEAASGGRVALHAAVAVLVAAACAVLAWRGASAWRALAGVGVLLLSLEGLNAVGPWLATGGHHVSDDAAWARYGLDLREATTSRATLATTWAGAAPYFSGRTAVDELGKSDRVLARERPRRHDFWPGHAKWDLAYSIGRLHPDVLADLVEAGPATFAEIEAWGYRRFGPEQFVSLDALAAGRVRPASLPRVLPTSVP